MEKNGKTFIKGLVIGATMTVPGVSGGSMAMVLGIYDRLLKKWKNSDQRSCDRFDHDFAGSQRRFHGYGSGDL